MSNSNDQLTPYMDWASGSPLAPRNGQKQASNSRKQSNGGGQLTPYEGWNRSPLIPRDYSTLKRKTVERRSIQKGQRFDSADWAMKVKETPSEQKTSLPKHLKN